MSQESPLLVEHLFAVGGDDEAVDAGEDFGGLALFESEAPEGVNAGRRFAGMGWRPRAFGDVEHAFFAGREIDVVAGGDGQGQDALVDAVEVDFDYDRLFSFFSLSRFRLFSVIRLRSLVVGLLCLQSAGRSFGVCPYVVFLLVLGLFVIAFGRERRGQIFGKHDDVDVAGDGAVEAGRSKPATEGPTLVRGGEVEILAVAIEGDAADVAHAIGDLRGFFRVEGIEEDRIHDGCAALEVGDPLAVGGPGGAARESEAFVDLPYRPGRDAVVDVEIPEMEFLVGVEDALGIGRPVRSVEVGRLGAEVDDLRRRNAVLIADVELVFAGGVAEVGDGFAVGGPGGIALGGVGVLVRLRASPFSAGTVKMSPWASKTARAPVGEMIGVDGSCADR